MAVGTLFRKGITLKPEEALQNNLSVCYGIITPVTSEMIEKVIEDVYRHWQDLPNTIMKARKKYEKIQKSNNDE